MDLKDINQIADASFTSRKEIFRVGLSLIFIISVLLYVAASTQAFEGHYLLTAAAVFGGYMALNIGANDVANNVGPAVGSKALSMAGAIVIAAIFEASGALLAGGDVVSTIKSDIIKIDMLGDSDTFIWLMMAALLAAAIWLNIATYLNAPVSTTHSIVGGVLGAGLAAGGLHIANWPVMGKIAASWVISPLLGGIFAALFLFIIKRKITYQQDMLAAATRVVPVLIAIMSWAFSVYILLKGVTHVWKIDTTTATIIGLAIATTIYFIVKNNIGRRSMQMADNKESVNTLFTLPLICSAALLSFAHGANDVANAVGPLAAINDAVLQHGIASKAPIPLWVMLVGATGISIGLALYGPKLIKTVGSEITELDKMRAFCIALSAAITVIFASQLGLPVSSTHTAVGAVFGVGFLREYLKHSNAKRMEEISLHHENSDPEQVEAFLKAFRNASIDEKGLMLKSLKQQAKLQEASLLTRQERKSLQKVYRQQLVKRSHLYRIAAAWLITVPLSGVMAGLIYFAIRGMLLP